MAHDHGIIADLTKAGFDRRRALGFFASGGAALLAGCHRGPPGNGPGGPGGGENAALIEAKGVDGVQCLNFTAETNGPYPADGSNQSNGSTSNVLTAKDIIRSDIRNDLGQGGRRALGVPLVIDLAIVDVNAACGALSGYAVYLWHCDASGAYSLYDKPQRSYLRGLQVTDSAGRVRFTTIVPGCYSGRYPHLHFEIFSTQQKATSGKFATLISQIAIPADVCGAVYKANPAYAGSVGNFVGESDPAKDMIFADNGEERIKAMTLNCTGNPVAGYNGKAMVGIAV